MIIPKLKKGQKRPQQNRAAYDHVSYVNMFYDDMLSYDIIVYDMLCHDVLVNICYRCANICNIRIVNICCVMLCYANCIVQQHVLRYDMFYCCGMLC